MATDKIPEAYIAKIRSLMLELLDDDQLLAQWFAQYMTEPKYPMLTDITGEQRRASINCADTSGGRRYFNNGLEQD